MFVQDASGSLLTIIRNSGQSPVWSPEAFLSLTLVTSLSSVCGGKERWLLHIQISVISWDSPHTAAFTAGSAEDPAGQRQWDIYHRREPFVKWQTFTGHCPASPLSARAAFLFTLSTQRCPDSRDCPSSQQGGLSTFKYKNKPGTVTVDAVMRMISDDMIFVPFGNNNNNIYDWVGSAGYRNHHPNSSPTHLPFALRMPL